MRLLITVQCTDESGANDTRIVGPRVRHCFHAAWPQRSRTGRLRDCPTVPTTHFTRIFCKFTHQDFISQPAKFDLGGIKLSMIKFALNKTTRTFFQGCMTHHTDYKDAGLAIYNSIYTF